MRLRYRCRYLLKFFFCFILIFILLAIVITKQTNPILVVRDLGYLTRPIWDKPGSEPEIIIPHFQSDTIPYDELCELHGWKKRDSSGSDRNLTRVIDAVIFSVELDILEIRIRELWDVVDIFLVMEADRTFTGVQKPLILEENIHRFEFAKDKLHHKVLRNTLKKNPKNNFENEVIMRREMSNAIRFLKPKYGDLIIVGDVDEIPFKKTIELLKNCVGYSRELHLRMRNYVYSFEFYIDTTNWKPHVDTYSSYFRYHHGKPTESTVSNYQLADAGWHCSYCFRYLSDFVFKMTSFSHSDRVTGQHLLDKNNIQRKICDGSNIFDMYEEAYTFKDLIGTFGKLPRKLSTIGIPAAVMDQHRFFKFLLPGGCVREDAPPEFNYSGR
ncbi:Beta-1,4-mannosyl-glycoprotein 4-beta-N-acetylglucosaminyltransferase [Pseudolycoriella hygida]|uniref:Beta-1,4-mannosyl-glycoprotein 4-beta-N-acetylglucosaminyltransferase n=1 Tax=Pseudolycoriella hygida TaxID=35572 RepID=A0A9Q0S1Z4_9DIPT|nr:Beta-1,4-mannosyl-glycoprotein 4-beta-N-acetylglucosaminyltransferase [Pseudolycoriella hygida]